MNYYLHNGVFYDTSTLRHHGVEGMHWGIRKYQNEDGSLTDFGRSRLRGYDGQESDWYAENFRNSEAYANNWQREYGSTPINRLRFEYDGSDTVNRGSKYCDDLDWNRTSLSSIYDSYREYRDSEDWD